MSELANFIGGLVAALEHELLMERGDADTIRAVIVAVEEAARVALPAGTFEHRSTR